MKRKTNKKSEELRDDLMPLYNLLVAQKIPCVIKIHPVAEKEPKAKEVLSFFPTGEHQILIQKDGTTYSVIRGYASFGNYEIFNIGKGEKFSEPERFETPEELIEKLIQK